MTVRLCPGKSQVTCSYGVLCRIGFHLACLMLIGCQDAATQHLSLESMTTEKENTMKTESKKSAAGKILSLAVVALVVAGASAISGVAEGSMTKVFTLFLGAVIVLQVVPCLMLMVAMFKGVFSLLSRQVAAAAEVSR